jgi:DNA-binding NarL/FixJ family response regulator
VPTNSVSTVGESGSSKSVFRSHNQVACARSRLGRLRRGASGRLRDPGRAPSLPQRFRPRSCFPPSWSSQVTTHGNAPGRILDASPHIGVLIVTMFEDDYSVFTAIRAGAKGYVLKDTDEKDILHTIRGVGRGEAIFSPAVARRVIDFFTGARSETGQTVPARAFPELTSREREILDLIAQGLSNPEITASLYLSPKTVGNHISNIFAKLQVADRAQAIIRAREAGLGD